MQIRLLGGSKHQKRMEVDRHRSEFIFQKPRLPKGKWNPSWDINPNTVTVIDTEIYELKKMRKAEQIGHNRVYIETKVAYIKKGSKIKPETFWKLAFLCDQYHDYGTVGR